MNYWFLIALVSLFYYLPWQSLMGYSWCIDLNVRLSPNDSFFGTYYFWWTNLLYLPTFFFALVALPFAAGASQSTRYLLYVPALFLASYPFELWDYLTSNTGLYSSLYHSYGSNSLLTNTLNRYHPLVFYVSSATLLVVFFQSIGLLTVNFKYATQSYLGKARATAWFGIFINLIALWMGSWWALQEGTWGGWWNWDSSETFGLMVSLILISIVHASFSLRQSIAFKHKLWVLTYCFILGYFFIQLNFELVSHNFGAKFFFFFNNNLFFLESVALLIVACYTALNRLKALNALTTIFGSNWTVLRPHSSFNVLGRLAMSVLLLYWVLFSYQPLVSYFLWNFAQINALNFESSLQYLNSTLWVAGLVWLLRAQAQLAFTVVVLCVLISNWKWLFLLLLIPTSWYAVSHSMLFLILTVNLSVFDLVTYSWLTFSEFNYVLCSNSCASQTYSTVILDNVGIEYSELWQSGGQVVSSVWNMASFTNVPILNFFSLLATNDYFQNFYTLSQTYTSVHFAMELPNLNQLNLFFFASILFSGLQAYWKPSATDV